jgi:hypothetical protein
MADLYFGDQNGLRSTADVIARLQTMSAQNQRNKL